MGRNLIASAMTEFFNTMSSAETLRISKHIDRQKYLSNFAYFQGIRNYIFSSSSLYIAISNVKF